MANLIEQLRENASSIKDEYRDAGLSAAVKFGTLTALLQLTLLLIWAANKAPKPVRRGIHVAYGLVFLLIAWLEANNRISFWIVLKTGSPIILAVFVIGYVGLSFLAAALFEFLATEKPEK